MGIVINDQDFETDDEGYLLEPQLGDDVPPQIAALDGLTLTDAHWTVIRYLRDAFREQGHTPNFRAMLKELAAIDPALDNKALYDLFPMGPAKQGVRIAGLPKPFGKGGY